MVGVQKLHAPRSYGEFAYVVQLLVLPDQYENK